MKFPLEIRQCNARIDSELFEYVPEVGVRGMRRNEELLCNLPVCTPRSREPSHRSFSIGQRLQPCLGPFGR